MPDPSTHTPHPLPQASRVGTESPMPRGSSELPRPAGEVPSPGGGGGLDPRSLRRQPDHPQDPSVTPKTACHLPAWARGGTRWVSSSTPPRSSIFNHQHATTPKEPKTAPSGHPRFLYLPPLPIAYCLLPLLLLTLLLPACVQRRIRVTSTPPGARVIINDQDIGQTPAQARFTFYGGFDVQILLPGYEPVHELRQAKAPLHEYPGIDLIATALPANFDHTVEWYFDLQQVPEATNPDQAHQDLLTRAAELRQRANSDSAD